MAPSTFHDIREAHPSTLRAEAAVVGWLAQVLLQESMYQTLNRSLIPSISYLLSPLLCSLLDIIVHDQCTNIRVKRNILSRLSSSFIEYCDLFE
ncbi:hypothetical protein ACQRIU_000922 [Beauveria bassiana]